MSRHYFLLGLLSISACLVSGRVLIVNGQKVKKANQFPYHVALRVDDKEICGGAIIGPEFVLTAAHCVIQEDNEFYHTRTFVLAGTHNLDVVHKPAVTVEVEKVFVPTEYKPPVFCTTGDIAVLKLKHRLDLSKFHGNLKEVKLPMNEHETYADKTAVIAGFGWDWINITSNYEEGGYSDSLLRYAEAEVLTTSQCQEDVTKRTISDKQICAKVKQHGTKPIGTCTGDSGGALVYDNTVIGILSISPIGCSEKVKAGIYTRVSHYMNFIREAMKNEKNANIRIFQLH